MINKILLNKIDNYINTLYKCNSDYNYTNDIEKDDIRSYYVTYINMKKIKNIFIKKTCEILEFRTISDVNLKYYYNSSYLDFRECKDNNSLIIFNSKLDDALVLTDFYSNLRIQNQIMDFLFDIKL